MKYSQFVLVFAASALASLQERATCNADNCARAVTGTFRGDATYSSRLADCSSFQRSTVYPAASTTTITSGSTSTTIIPPGVTPLSTASTAQPSNTPAYASACSGTSRYSSACSCGGAGPTGTTLAVPTVTVVKPTPAPQPYQPCNGPPYGNQAGPGAGGCPSQCYCDHDVGGFGFCENATGCGPGCASDADCPSGTKCTDSYPQQCGGPTCLDSSSCVVNSGKRGLPFGARGLGAMGKREGGVLHPGKVVVGAS